MRIEDGERSEDHMSHRLRNVIRIARKMRDIAPYLLISGLAGIIVTGLVLMNAGPVAAQGPVDGKAIYGERCAFCHGQEGDGNGPVAKFLNPRPRDFTSGQFKFRTTASGEIPLREDVIAIVKAGVRSTAMPSWEDILSQEEIEAVVDYVTESFVPFWGTYDPPVIEIPNPPGVNDGMITQGEEIFQTLQCWKCHGQVGRADGQSAATLTDELDYPILPADLTKAWRYKGGSELADIYTRFSTGMNGSPMPSFFDVISNDERWALAAYVQSLQVNEPTDQSVVTAIRIEGALPSSADDAAWERAQAVSFYLTGQVIAAPRWQTPGVDGVTVRALHNDQSVALLVEWDDPFNDTETGGSEGTVGSDNYVDLDAFRDSAGPFPDALAIQFPQTLNVGPRKPYFFWGQAGQPVNLWRWQADGSVAEFNAAGFQAGLQPQETSDVTASATWADGQYRAVFTRAFITDDANDVQMARGDFIPIAFQAWEGSNGEAGTRLSLSSWYSLRLEEPVPTSVYLYTGLVVILVAAAEFVLIRRVRKNKT